MPAFEIMLPLKSWGCRIGRVSLKPGFSMFCPHPCGNFY